MARWKKIATAPKDRQIEARGHDFGDPANPKHTVITQWDEQWGGWYSPDGSDEYHYLIEWREISA